MSTVILMKCHSQCFILIFYPVSKPTACLEKFSITIVKKKENFFYYVIFRYVFCFSDWKKKRKAEKLKIEKWVMEGWKGYS